MPSFPVGDDEYGDERFAPPMSRAVPRGRIGWSPSRVRLPVHLVRLTARWRLLLARHRWMRWSILGVLALIVAGRISGLEAREQAAIARWGSTVELWTATRDLVAGTTLGPQDLRSRAYPLALSPPGAVTTAAWNAVLGRDVGIGEVLVAEDLAAKDSGPHPMGPDQIALVLDPRGLPVSAGDRILAVLDDSWAPTESSPVALDHMVEATVLEVLGEDRVDPFDALAGFRILVALDAAQGPRVARAARSGDLTLLLDGRVQRQPATMTSPTTPAVRTR